MSSRLVKNTSLYTIGNVLPKFAGFFLIPIYTRFLSPADYGIINSMAVLSSILFVLFTLAINRSIPRLYFDYKTEKEQKDYLGTIIIIMSLLSFIILILLFLLRKYVGLIYESIDFYPYFVLVIITSYLSVFSQVPMIYLRVTEKVKSFVGISLVQFFVGTCFGILFIVILKKGALGAMVGSLLSAIVILPVFIIISIKIMNISFKKDILTESLYFSLPLLPSILSAWILNLSDRIFIEHYFSLSEVGIYSMGYKFAAYVLLFTEAFNRAYEPTFYSLANSDKPAEFVKEQLGKYNYVYLSTILFFCFLLSFFSKEIIMILLDSRYHEAYKITMLITLAYLISQSSHIFGLSIIQKKKTIITMWLIIIAAILNIGLNFMLIPSMGIYGAAFATIIAFGVKFILQCHYAKKCFYIPMEWMKLSSQFVILFIIVCVTHFLFLKVNVILSLMIKMMIVSVLCLTIYRETSLLIFSKIKPKIIPYFSGA